MLRVVVYWFLVCTWGDLEVMFEYVLEHLEVQYLCPVPLGLVRLALDFPGILCCGFVFIIDLSP